MQRNKLSVIFSINIVILLTLSCAANQPGKYKRTFILLKPDAVQRGLVGKIIQRFEAKGFKLVAMKFVWPTKKLIEQHYAELVNREFYSRLVEDMISGPVIPMVWEGLNAVQIGRQMLGKAEPLESPPGTIRGDFSIDIERTIIHGSHSIQAADKEIRLWFDKNELIPWTLANVKWIYE